LKSVRGSTTVVAAELPATSLLPGTLVGFDESVDWSALQPAENKVAAVATAAATTRVLQDRSENMESSFLGGFW
jgi:hypothetical protein